MLDLDSIAVDPELFRLAHLHGMAPVLRLWTALRHFDTGKSGRASLANQQQCAELLNVQPRTIQRLIQNFPPWFAIDPGGIVRYTSLAKLLKFYDWPPTRYSGTAEIPLAQVGGLGTFNAFCYAAWFTLHCKDAEITGLLSRDLLLAKFGVNERTLHRWEKKSGLLAEANYGLQKYDEETDDKGEIHCTCGHYWYNQNVARAKEGDPTFTSKLTHADQHLELPAEHRAKCPGHTFVQVRQRANAYAPPQTITGHRRPTFLRVYKEQLRAASSVPAITGAHADQLDAAKTEPKTRRYTPYANYTPWKKSDPCPPKILAKCRKERQLWWA